MLNVLKFLKVSRDPDHTPVRGICIAGVGLAVVDPLAKFTECSFIHSRDIEGL